MAYSLADFAELGKRVGKSRKPPRQSYQEGYQEGQFLRAQEENQLQSSMRLAKYKSGLQKQEQADLIRQTGGMGGVTTKYTSGGLTVEFPQGKSQVKAVQDMDEFSSDATRIFSALDNLEKTSVGLGDFKTGFWNQAAAKTRFNVRSFGMEENETKYLASLNQELIPLARKYMEEKGPITEWDVGRVQTGLGRPTTPLNTKKEIFNDIRSKTKLLIANKARLAGMSDQQFAEKYPQLYQIAFSKEVPSQSIPQQGMQSSASIEQNYNTRVNELIRRGLDRREAEQQAGRELGLE